MRTFRVAAIAIAALSLARTGAADTIIVDKVPTDALCCINGLPNGAFLLAGNFLFGGASGTLMRTVGAYMQREGDGPSPGTAAQFVFRVFADQTDALGNPDLSRIFSSPFLAETRDASGFPGSDYVPPGPPSVLVTALLEDVHRTPEPVSLVNGYRYWIAIWIPFATPGSYDVGILPGTGGFAVSADRSLVTVLDASDIGLNPTTDLAIYATGTEPVPEPATLSLIGAGVLMLASRRYKARNADLPRSGASTKVANP